MGTSEERMGWDDCVSNDRPCACQCSLCGSAGQLLFDHRQSGNPYVLQGRNAEVVVVSHEKTAEV